ncbi:MAG TPA: hypothetical protein PKK43_08065 [Spirochaetota bacterium]|nr:hypothetical protein [Spirochaetota bacterium]
MNRESLLEFIADLSGPVGPEVFAGYGSDIQSRMADEPLEYFAIIREWGEKVDVGEVFPLIIDVMRNPPDASFINNFYGRFTEFWNGTISDLIDQCVERDEPAVRRVIAGYRIDPCYSECLTEIESIISEDE